MRKIRIALLLALYLIMSVGTVFADGDPEETLPRVDLVNMAEPGVLALTMDSEPLEIYLMFQSDALNFIWPAKIKVSGTAGASGTKNFALVIYNDDRCVERQSVTLKDEWDAHSVYCLEAVPPVSPVIGKVVIAGSEEENVSTAPAVLETAESSAADSLPVELYVDNVYQGVYKWSAITDDLMPEMDNVIETVTPEPENADGGTQQPVITYDDPRILFALGSPWQGGFLDTGLNLYSGNMDYTIFLKLNTGQQEPGTMTILSDSNNEMHGLVVQAAGNGTDEYTMFFAGACTYEALYAMADDGCAYVTIRKEGDTYTFFGKDVNDQRRFDSPVTTEISTNLILGGRYYQTEDGSLVVVDSYTGTVEQCRVYGQALEDGEIAEILAELKTE